MATARSTAPAKATQPAQAAQPAQPAKAAPAKPGRKPRIPKVYEPLDINAITAQAVTGRMNMAQARPVRVERDPQQKAVDKIVEDAYKLWIEAGQPTTWVVEGDTQAGMRISVPEKQLETLQNRLGKAGLHYSLKIRYGNIKRKDGNAEFVFIAMERPKDSKSETEPGPEPEPESESGTEAGTDVNAEAKTADGETPSAGQQERR